MVVDSVDASASDGLEGAAVLGCSHDAEGIIYGYRCGIAWRDLSDSCGLWQTVWTWHRTDYKNCNVIERRLCDVKQWRGLATRYDKHVIVYRAALIQAAIASSKRSAPRITAVTPGTWSRSFPMRVRIDS